MLELQATQSILTKALLKAAETDARRLRSPQLAIGEISDLDQNTIQNNGLN